MSQLRTRRICIAFVAALSACATDEKTPADEAGPPAPNVVSLSTGEYAFQAPDTVPAGWTTLRMANHGQEVHYGHIVRLDSGITARELLDEYAEAIRTSGPRPTLMTRFGGPGGTAPGDSSSVTQYLEPGNYVWICPVEDHAGNPHFGKGEFKAFVVRAGGTGVTDRSAAPNADMVVRLLDYSFGLDSPVVAGRHMIRVENKGAQGHDLVLMKLAAGKTIADIKKWLNPERARRPGEADDPPPPLESLASLAGGIATIAAGMESFFETDLIRGEYVLVCMTTAPDGRSHIEHGMIRQISVE